MSYYRRDSFTGRADGLFSGPQRKSHSHQIEDWNAEQTIDLSAHQDTTHCVILWSRYPHLNFDFVADHESLINLLQKIDPQTAILIKLVGLRFDASLHHSLVFVMTPTVYQPFTPSRQVRILSNFLLYRRFKQLILY